MGKENEGNMPDYVLPPIIKRGEIGRIGRIVSYCKTKNKATKGAGSATATINSEVRSLS